MGKAKAQLPIQKHLGGLFNKGVKKATPEKNWVWESAGYGVLIMALFMFLAMLSYQPSATGAPQTNNWAGPFGNAIASALMESIGMIAYSWPMLIGFWGLMIVLGFFRRVRSKRLAAFFLLNIVGAAFCEVMSPDQALTFSVYGPGGKVGEVFGSMLLGNIGFGGSLIFLMGSGLIALAITGNLQLSRTAEVVEYFQYIILRKVDQTQKAVKQKKQNGVKKVQQPVQPLMDEMPAVEPAMDEQLEVDKPKKRGRKKAKMEEAPSEPQTEITENTEESVSLGEPGLKVPKPDPGIFKKASISSSGQKTMDPKFLESHLAEFKVPGKVKNITKGPVVTTYEFEPKAGTKVAKIAALSEDLARVLQTKSLRVLTPLPGKDTVGFEIPNDERKVIRFGNLLASQEFKNKKHHLPIALGVDTFGKTKVVDLAEMPHLLIAGSTGSGKSVFLNSLLASLLCRHSPKDLKLVLVDPKMVELAPFAKIGHLSCPIITDTANDGPKILSDLVDEMEKRYKLMGELGAKNIYGYNETIKNKRKTQYPEFSGKWQIFPFVVLVIDEFADLILSAGKEVEERVTRLAQKARAAGIHLVVATQRPSVQVVTGLIKANFPTRVAFRVLSGVDSRTIIDSMGAEKLLGKGDLLYLSSNGTDRLHAPFLDEGEIAKLAKACKPVLGSKKKAA